MAKIKQTVEVETETEYIIGANSIRRVVKSRAMGQLVGMQCSLLHVDKWIHEDGSNTPVSKEFLSLVEGLHKCGEECVDADAAEGKIALPFAAAEEMK